MPPRSRRVPTRWQPECRSQQEQVSTWLWWLHTEGLVFSKFAVSRLTPPFPHSDRRPHPVRQASLALASRIRAVLPATEQCPARCDHACMLKCDSNRKTLSRSTRDHLSRVRLTISARTDDGRSRVRRESCPVSTHGGVIPASRTYEFRLYVRFSIRSLVEQGVNLLPWLPRVSHVRYSGKGKTVSAYYTAKKVDPRGKASTVSPAEITP